MNKPRIYIRADGNSHIGLGHVYRMVALAQMLRQNFECTFGMQHPQQETIDLIRGSGFNLHVLPLESDYALEAAHLSESLAEYSIFVLDGYYFDSQYQKILKEAKKSVINIDDMHACHFYADVVINHAPGANSTSYSMEPYTQLYLGTDYALIREPFASSRGKTTNQYPVKNVFVSFGGADPNNLTEQITRQLVESFSFEKITVVTGAAYRHLNTLTCLVSAHSSVFHAHDVSANDLYTMMCSADVALVPASTILFEVLATGVTPITGYYVINQKDIYEGFLNWNVVSGLGDFNTVTSDTFNDHLQNFLACEEKINQLNSRIRTIFDGKVKDRINNIFLTLT